MRSDTKSVSIETPPEKALKFLSDPRNLPRWAVGFAKAVENEEGRWVVATGSGKVSIRIRAVLDGGLGVLSE